MSKLLYEYPTKHDKVLKRRDMAGEMGKLKKIRRRLLLSCIVSVVIVIIGVTSESLMTAILLSAAASISLGLSLTAYRLSVLQNSSENTRIFDDRLEHETEMFFGGKRFYKVSFDDVEKSFQDRYGNLVFQLKNNKAEVYDVRNGKKKNVVIQNNRLPVCFRITQSKLFLINKLPEKINYPIKHYNTITDDTDSEKEWFDRI